MGRPDNIEDVRSFLMACQYNAKFTFDHPEVKDSPQKDIEEGCEIPMGQGSRGSLDIKLLKLMKSPATLRAYDPTLSTHYVADSSKVGIQASI